MTTSAPLGWITDTPVQYESIPYGTPIPAGAVCVACGSSILLVRDHCHEHGWVRDIVCYRCNLYLSIIDRRATPGVKEKHLAALIAVRNRCGDCAKIGVADLAPIVQPEPPARTPIPHSEEPKIREDRLRRAARRQGLRLSKNPRRDPRASDYGSYMLINENNVIVADFGWDHVGFPDGDSWLDDIEAYLTSDPEGE